MFCTIHNLAQASEVIKTRKKLLLDKYGQFLHKNMRPELLAICLHTATSQSIFKMMVYPK